MRGYLCHGSHGETPMTSRKKKKNLHSGLEQSMETFAIGIVDGDFTRNVLKDPGDFLEAIYGGGCNQP